MFAKTYGATTLGIDGRIIDVEVDVSPGLPGFELVGLPDTSVKESKERVRTAIRNSGIQLRQERVTVNPCPCGYFEDKEKSCGCMPNEIKRYAKKLSRTLLDRNALQHIHVSCEVCTTLYSTCETNVFEDFPLFP